MAIDNFLSGLIYGIPDEFVTNLGQGIYARALMMPLFYQYFVCNGPKVYDGNHTCLNHVGTRGLLNFTEIYLYIF